MNRYLLFRLYGPMAAWGGTAVGEYRPSDAQPSRTAILGLLAAAVGIRRDQEDALNDLDRSVEIAVRLDMPGEVMRDYHTTQVPPEGKSYAITDEATKPARRNCIPYCPSATTAPTAAPPSHCDCSPPTRIASLAGKLP